MAGGTNKSWVAFIWCVSFWICLFITLSIVFSETEEVPPTPFIGETNLNTACLGVIEYWYIVSNTPPSSALAPKYNINGTLVLCQDY